MTIGKRVGIAVVAFTVAAAWALPAPAAEVSTTPAPATEAQGAPAPKVKTATPAPKVKKKRIVRKFWRHRPIRVASVDWSWSRSHHWAVSHVVLGVGF
jgi:hypothetical protein